MKRITGIIFCLAFALKAVSAGTGTWEPVSKTDFLKSYQKAIEWFSKTQKISVSITYASFMDHNSISPYEKSTGYYLKDGKKAYTNIMSIKTVQNEKFFFTVDTVEKTIVLNKLPENDYHLIDMKTFESMMNHVKAFGKKRTAAGTTVYRIEFKPDVLYSSFEIELDAEGLLKKEIFYYATEMKEETDEADEYGNVNKSSVSGKPRLEIGFSNYQSQLKAYEILEFSEKKYFSQVGNKIVLASRCKGYQLKDYRLDLKK